jgi:hypothetical protein
MQTANFTYNLNIRLSGDELDALARMANREYRDVKRQAVVVLRKLLIDDGYLISDPTSDLASKAIT